MTYAEMVFEAMFSEKRAQPLYAHLRALKRKQDAERELLRRMHQKHPGLTDTEILKAYGGSK